MNSSEGGFWSDESSYVRNEKTFQWNIKFSNFDKKKYIFTWNSSPQLDVSPESRPQIDFQILGLKSLQILESNSST